MRDLQNLKGVKCILNPNPGQRYPAAIFLLSSSPLYSLIFTQMQVYYIYASKTQKRHASGNVMGVTFGLSLYSSVNNFGKGEEGSEG